MATEIDKENYMGESDQGFTIDPKNYASDEELSGRALELVRSIGIELETRRSSLNEKYLEYYNSYRCQFDVRYYNGESQVYIPEIRKIVEQWVSRVKKALFPTDDVFEVEPIDPEQEDEAELIEDYLKWTIDKRVKLKSSIDRFLRNLGLYGWALVECGWEEDIKKVLGLAKRQKPVFTTEVDPITGEKTQVETGEVETEVYETVKEIVKKRNPTFDSLDNFAAYMWPNTANSIDEVYGVLTFSKPTLNDLLVKQHKGIYENIPDHVSERLDMMDQWKWALEARLNVDGLSDEEYRNIVPRLTLIKYYGLFNWGTETNPDEQETVITTIGGNICIELRKCQYYDQDKPYLLARINELQNETHSMGIVAPLISMQWYLNDTAAQTFDSSYYSLNPIVKYNPGMVLNIDSIAFAPGAMWALSDPTAADIIRPPEVASLGFQIMGAVKSYIEEYPGLQNVPITGRKAALHIQALQEQYLVPIQQVVENLEETVMSPWLKKAYNRIQQFLNKAEIVKVTGKNGMKYWRTISPENLVGDYNFYWRGANQTTNLHVKSQQIAQYLNTLAPWVPLFLQTQKIPNVQWLFEQYWSDGLGLKGKNKLFDSLADYPSLEPEIENFIMSLGKPLPTSVADDPQYHMQVHEILLQHESQEVRQIGQMHIQKHNEDFAKLQKLMQQQIPAQDIQNQNEAEASGEEVQGERQMESNQPV